jgi:hypothetical protein
MADGLSGFSGFSGFSDDTRIKLTAGGTLPAYRFTNAYGVLCNTPTKPLGISDANYVAANLATIQTTGKTRLTLAESVDVNDPLICGYSGFAVKATSDFDAIALQAGISGDTVDVALKAGASASNQSAQTVLSAKVTITPDQIRALHTTPIELIPAPGTGKIIFAHDVYAYSKYETAAYSIAADKYLRFSANDNFLQDVFGMTTLITGTNSRCMQMNFVTSTYETYDSVVDTNLNVRVTSAITGSSATGTLTLIVTYSIIDFN